MSAQQQAEDGPATDARGPREVAAGVPPRQGGWVERPRALRFRLGELGLGQATLRALVLEGHPPGERGQSEPRLPFDRFPRGIDLAAAPSYPTGDRLPRLKLVGGAIRYVPSQYRRHYVVLSGSFDAYLDKFSSKSRATLRKKVRKFAEFSGGEVRWREYRTGGMEQFHREAFAVSSRSYQARLLGVGLPEPDAFRRSLARFDDARGYVLYHDTRPVAYIFCPVRDGNVLYQYVGYDPDFQQWSPGTVLQYLALESLFVEGRFRTFDFTEGEGAHKRFFANESVYCADILYFRKTPANLLIVGLHAGLDAAARLAGSALARVGLKSRIKRLIRGWPRGRPGPTASNASK